MKKVYKYKEARNLIPGMVYQLWVLKIIQFPDGKEYYILRDPNGDKHLLPSKPYKKYNIRPETYCNCRLDKINCLGRMYFEPLHPKYREGEKYRFKFVKSAFLVSKKQGMEHYLLFRDGEGENAYLEFNPHHKIDRNLFDSYRIVKIKKARIFIEKIIS